MGELQTAQFLLAVALGNWIGVCIQQQQESLRELPGSWLVVSSSVTEAVLILFVLLVLLVTVLLRAIFLNPERLLCLVPYLFQPVLWTLWPYDNRKKCSLILYPFFSVLACTAYVITVLELPSYLLHKVKITLAPSWSVSWSFFMVKNMSILIGSC